MNWAIELAPEAVRELNRLDAQVFRRILKFLRDRVAKLKDPRSIGSALQAPDWASFGSIELVITGSSAELKMTDC
jgi:mRNA interferase RelE/StbE